MMARFKDESLRFFNGDVRDQERLVRAMHGVDIVFHAASLCDDGRASGRLLEAIERMVGG
jgi:UDP-N-acetylglucosamine 4,6-dehydratase/5-epimerase